MAATVGRLHPWIPAERVTVVTQAACADGVLGVVPAAGVVVEPVGRNTAPAVALGLISLISRHRGSTPVIILPSDHRVADAAAWRACLAAGVRAVEAGAPVATLGVVPDRPEPGYGYLELAGPLDPAQAVYPVLRFVEKPPPAVAARYAADGRHLWNAGVFIWTLSGLRQAFEDHLPPVAALIDEALAASDPAAVAAERYADLEAQSLDFGIMEHMQGVVAVPADVGWDDLGSLSALERLLPGDGDGNTLVAPFVGFDNQGLIVKGSDRLIAAFGLRDLMIVDTGDVVMVCPKGRDADIRTLVAKVQAAGFEEVL